MGVHIKKGQQKRLVDSCGVWHEPIKFEGENGNIMEITVFSIFFPVFVAHFGLLGEAGENFIHATVDLRPDGLLRWQWKWGGQKLIWTNPSVTGATS